MSKTVLNEYVLVFVVFFFGFCYETQIYFTINILKMKEKLSFDKGYPCFSFAAQLNLSNFF